MESRSVWTWDLPRLGVLAFILAICVYRWRADSVIVSQQATVQGIITAHRTGRFFSEEYGYVFFVNGQGFTGWDRDQKNGLEIGMQTLVYYDSKNPNSSALTDFAESSRDYIALSFLVVGLGAVAWYIRSRRALRL
jgi:hypothetical protein